MLLGAGANGLVKPARSGPRACLWGRGVRGSLAWGERMARVDWVLLCLLFPPVVSATTAARWHLSCQRASRPAVPRRQAPSRRMPRWEPADEKAPDGRTLRGSSAVEHAAELVLVLGLLAFWAVVPNWFLWGWWARSLALALFGLAAVLRALAAWRELAAGRAVPRLRARWVESGIVIALGLAGLVAAGWAVGVRGCTDAVQVEFPLRGDWYVAHGGPTVLTNHHHSSVSQRYALDLIRLDTAGRSYHGDRGQLASYYAWDSPVYAPVGGRVVAAVGDLPDQPPGVPDPGHPPGNHVVLETADGVRVWLAHLRRGSVAVGAGEAVSAGRLVGRVGNSGNSTEPHLHLHAEVGATGAGVPILFTGLDDGPPFPRRGHSLSRSR